MQKIIISLVVIIIYSVSVGGLAWYSGDQHAKAAYRTQIILSQKRINKLSAKLRDNTQRAADATQAKLKADEGRISAIKTTSNKSAEIRRLNTIIRQATTKKAGPEHATTNSPGRFRVVDIDSIARVYQLSRTVKLP